MSFRTSVALLIFCLDDLSIDVNGVLRSTIIVLLSVSPFVSVSMFKELIPTLLKLFQKIEEGTLPNSF